MSIRLQNSFHALGSGKITFPSQSKPKKQKVNILSLPSPVLGKVLAFAGNIATTSKVSKQFAAALPDAYAETYASVQKRPNWVGRVIKNMEESSFISLPPGKSNKLKFAKRSIVEELSKDRLFMKSDPQWQAIIENRDLSQLSFDKLDQLHEILILRRAEILISFIESFIVTVEGILGAEPGDNIHAQNAEILKAYLNGIAHLDPIQRAEEIREWLKWPGIEESLWVVISFAIQNNLMFTPFQPVPPEIVNIVLKHELHLELLNCYLIDRDVSTFFEIFRNLRSNQLVELWSELKVTLVHRLIDLGDLAFFQELRKYPEFQDIDQVLLNDLTVRPVIQFPTQEGRELQRLAVLEDCISFPTAGPLYLFMLIMIHLNREDWASVRDLFHHPRISDVVSQVQVEERWLKRFVFEFIQVSKIAPRDISLGILKVVCQWILNHKGAVSSAALSSARSIASQIAQNQVARARDAANQIIHTFDTYPFEVAAAACGVSAMAVVLYSALSSD